MRRYNGLCLQKLTKCTKFSRQSDWSVFRPPCHALTCFSAMDFSADMPSISSLALTAAAALCSW
jgi:hypothetical protein